ncbi:ATP-grasp domain-containing protein [Streptomyces sp. NPDC052727]|uniref:ATP-grasp domain-containing protein n=1 Tax=Streptomyces sp. NPDC052727 TaxID=3154854 RepID=UPI003440A2E1
MIFGGFHSMHGRLAPVDAHSVDSPPGTVDDVRPTVLLVGCGMSADFREWIVESISRHYRIWLMDHRPLTWARPYVIGHTEIDALDLDKALTAAAALQRSVSLAGVVCYDEMRIWSAARIAEELGLPTSPADAVLACRDKKTSRERMAAAGTPQARSLFVRSLDEARSAVEEVGYPAILKPRDLAASEGVARVDGPDELARWFSFTAEAAGIPGDGSTESGILVEEYLDGPEIAVDVVVYDGQVTPVVVSHKQLGYPPSFEEVGHFVAADDPLLHDAELLTVLESAHSALGFTHGVSHVELRLTKTGPRVIEVNARLGGDLIPYLGLLATGVDLARAAADLAVGRRPDLTPRRSLAAAIRFLYPDSDLVVESIEIAPHRLPRGIWRAVPVAEPGEKLLLPPRAFVIGRAALGIAFGTDAEDCARVLDDLPQAVTVRGQAIPSTP